MITITCLSDFDRAVAEAAFCPEPPLSERRAIHESGAWRWVPRRYKTTAPAKYELVEGHWEPALFSTDPSASYALEHRMRELGYQIVMDSYVDAPGWAVQCVTDSACRAGCFGIWSGHQSRLSAMCAAALRALGVKLEFREGWNAR